MYTWPVSGEGALFQVERGEWAETRVGGDSGVGGAKGKRGR